MTQAVAPAAAAPPNVSPHPRPLFSFGLISDVQHADIADGASFHGTPRFYREALSQLDRAVEYFGAQRVDFAVHLGDIIDYHNSVQPPPVEPGAATASEVALRNVLSRFDRLRRPVLHMLGNHCLYCHPRAELNQRLRIREHQGEGEVPHSYYTYTPASGWKVIVLDGYDVSVLGWPEGHPLHSQALATLQQRNPNTNKNSAEGLEGPARRYVQFGGGCSQAQLAWLAAELAACRAGGERALLASHLCFHPATCAPACLAWTYDVVLELLQSYSDVVVATLAGHAHQDGYFQDEAGIHHRVCKAVLETPPGRDCYGVVRCYPDRLVVEGVDTFASGEWLFGPPAASSSPAAPSTAAPTAAAPTQQLDTAATAQVGSSSGGAEQLQQAVETAAG